MSSLPPMALELTEAGIYAPVEAPPCAQWLLIPQRDIQLCCDRIRGHEGKHRKVLRAQKPHAVQWCDGFHCAAPCGPVAGWIETIRAQGADVFHIRTGGEGQ
jgi:hypothetical protein